MVSELNGFMVLVVGFRQCGFVGLELEGFTAEGFV